MDSKYKQQKKKNVKCGEIEQTMNPKKAVGTLKESR